MLGQKERFTAWVAQQDPDQRYDFIDKWDCAFARFEKEEGSWHGPRYANRPGKLNLPDWALEPLIESNTYGELLERLREHDGNAPAS